MPALLVVLFLWCANSAIAQPAHRQIPVFDAVYHQISALQARGHLKALTPHSLPYTEGEVRSALDAIPQEALDADARLAQRVARLRAALRPAAPADGKTDFGLLFEPGLDVSNSRRLDMLRATDVSGSSLEVSGAALFPYVRIEISAERGPMYLQAGGRHSVAYEDDPDAYSIMRRAMSRSENTFLSLNYPLARFTVGRQQRHWGPAGHPALLMSDNARAFDQLHLKLGNSTLQMEAFLGELDSSTRDGQFDGRRGDSHLGDPGIRRFLTGHRLTYRPTPNWAITIEETNLYSGPNASPGIRFLNPLHPLIVESDGTPKNDENNLLTGGSLWYQRGKVTLYGQLLLDDFDLNYGKEPPSSALTGFVRKADVMRDVDVTLHGTAVTRRAYNTHQPEGKYIFARRSLGAPFNDYVHTGIYAETDLDGWVRGLAVRPALDVLWQGTGNLFEPYPSDDADLMLGDPVAQTVRLSLQARWYPKPWAWVHLDAGLNRTEQLGLVEHRFAGWVSGGVRLDLRYRTPFN